MQEKTRKTALIAEQPEPVSVSKDNGMGNKVTPMKNVSASFESSNGGSPAKMLRLTNYNMGLGRMLAGVLICPPALVLATYLWSRVTDDPHEYLIVLMIYGFGLFFGWKARGAILWMQLDDRVSVRTLFGVRQYAYSEIDRVETGYEKGRYASYLTLYLVLKSGRRHAIKVNEKEIWQVSKFIAEQQSRLAEGSWADKLPEARSGEIPPKQRRQTGAEA
jgi:hypothetical protein